MLGQVISQEEEREKSSEEKLPLNPFQQPALMEEQWCYDVVTDPQASCDAAAVQLTLN